MINDYEHRVLSNLSVCIAMMTILCLSKIEPLILQARFKIPITEQLKSGLLSSLFTMVVAMAITWMIIVIGVLVVLYYLHQQDAKEEREIIVNLDTFAGIFALVCFTTDLIVFNFGPRALVELRFWLLGAIRGIGIAVVTVVILAVTHIFKIRGN